MRLDSGANAIMVVPFHLSAVLRAGFMTECAACRILWMSHFLINISNPRPRLHLRWTNRARFVRAFRPDIACGTTHIT